jgi:hypothetical protein
MTVFLNGASCGLPEDDVSEILTSSIREMYRVYSVSKDLQMLQNVHKQVITFYIVVISEDCNPNS